MIDSFEKNKRFLKETEQAVRVANNEIIHKVVPPITSERMLTLAVAIAKLRAQYIDAAFRFADSGHGEGVGNTAEIDALDAYRRQFEVARDAYQALYRAIELGYVDVEISPDEA